MELFLHTFLIHVTSKVSLIEAGNECAKLAEEYGTRDLIPSKQISVNCSFVF